MFPFDDVIMHLAYVYPYTGRVAYKSVVNHSQKKLSVETEDASNQNN